MSVLSIAYVTTIIMHLKMLRMTHLGNKLLVLLVQVSGGRHIVSPYSQPAFLSKPDKKQGCKSFRQIRSAKGIHHRHGSKEYMILPPTRHPEERQSVKFD